MQSQWTRPLRFRPSFPGRLAPSVAALAILFVAATASAQSDDSWGSTEPAAPTSSSRSSSGDGEGYDYTGPYVQGGFSIGRIDWDGNADSDASGGFLLGGGYRILPWLAIDGQFQFMGGQENVDIGPDRDSEFFAFTVGPKVFPLGFFEIEDIPETIQPYASINLGGGEADIEGGREDGVFVARFILGVDWWVTESLGVFVEGGGYAASGGLVDGVGTFNLGASWRF